MLNEIIGTVLQVFVFCRITQNPIFLVIIFLVPSVGAYVSVFLNEKLANGSIIHSWISHGLAKVLAYGIVGFVL